MLKYRCLKHPEELQEIRFDHLKVTYCCKHCKRENTTGKNSHLWKGGTTELNHYLRGRLGEWKKECLEKYMYKCYITNRKSNKLHVHHANQSFSNIVRDTMESLSMPIYENINKYSHEELNQISEVFVSNHQDVEGIPIEKDLHFLFHSLFGSDEETDLNDLEVFKYLYNNGDIHL